MGTERRPERIAAHRERVNRGILRRGGINKRNASGRIKEMIEIDRERVAERKGVSVAQAITRDFDLTIDACGSSACIIVPY